MQKIIYCLSCILLCGFAMLVANNGNGYEKPIPNNSIYGSWIANNTTENLANQYNGDYVGFTIPSITAKDIDMEIVDNVSDMVPASAPGSKYIPLDGGIYLVDISIYYSTYPGEADHAFDLFRTNKHEDVLLSQINNVTDNFAHLTIIIPLKGGEQLSVRAHGTSSINTGTFTISRLGPLPVSNE